MSDAKTDSSPHQSAQLNISRYDPLWDGAIPASLTGRYLYASQETSNGFRAPSAHYPTLHAVSVRNGKADWYKKRTFGLTEERTRNAPRHEQMRRGGRATFDHSVFAFAGRLFTQQDQCMPCELSPALDGLRAENFGGSMLTSLCCHPKHANGCLWTLADSIEKPFLHVAAINEQGLLRSSHAIALPKRVLSHDFAITAKSLIVFDQPVVFDEELALSRTSANAYRWDERHAARLGVAPLSDPSAIEWIDIPHSFITHCINAYEDKDVIVLDVINHDRLFHMHPCWFGECAPRVERWLIDRRRHRAIQDVVDDTAQELPRICPKRRGQSYRYVYTVGASLDASGRLHMSSSTVMKRDLARMTRQEFHFGDDVQLGELCFVPAADSSRGRSRQPAEDQGWLVGFVFDKKSASSEFVIIDAADLTAGPVARVCIPEEVRFAGHGEWVRG